MADRQVPFSAPMVTALRAGTKTQTRRGLKQQPYEFEGRWWIVDRYSGDCHLGDWLAGRVGAGPTIQPGDRLWVCESYFQFVHWTPDAKGAAAPEG
ncbi:hypothetical protein [Bosea rubneri]|uniref:Uncharacterized protein n=1 Tax=Bosea rubneri TaxID=3075434 RepID=A0ABU3SAE7_9HYPH|nr:hypothetical protein [Bosea sp. ZW T0_25]MDU0341340.1 hypothetical protein [Bosea sp. ZW T0_25]